MASPDNTATTLPINAPMLLTWARIAMIPMLIGVYYAPEAWLSAGTRNVAGCVIFTLAALTDVFDGYLARKYAMVTPLGAFLDPVADKLMVCAALVVLLALARVDAVIAIVIIGREIAVSALREWMAQMGASASVAVNWLGKLKTIMQMVAIPMLLYHDSLFGVIPIAPIGTILLYVAAVLTVYSMLYYLRLAWPHLTQSAAPRR